MRFKRLATWVLVGGLGLTAGCQSSNPCNTCSSGGGLMSRFGFNRPRLFHDSSVVGTPVSGGTSCEGDGCCGDGPVLGDPTFMGTPGTIPSVTAPPPGLPQPNDRLQPVPGTTVPGTASPLPAGPSSRWRW